MNAALAAAVFSSTPWWLATVLSMSRTRLRKWLLSSDYPGSIAAIEGPNEINAWPISYEGTTDTYAAGVQVTQDLWTAVQSNPSLEAVPVYALTLSYGITGVAAGEGQLGDLAPYVTYGNAHVYASSSNVWQENMPYWLPILKQDTPGLPAVITETGYTTTPSYVDELSAAKYNLNTFFENALNGIAENLSL